VTTAVLARRNRPTGPADLGAKQEHHVSQASYSRQEPLTLTSGTPNGRLAASVEIAGAVAELARQALARDF
jgi:hypothetical protein